MPTNAISPGRRKTMKSIEVPAKKTKAKPFVSIVVPAYNEASIMERNLEKLCEYMKSLEEEYRWELIIVNDGSTDETGELAETFARNRNNIHVLHHHVNFRLGQALRFAFNNFKGDYVITMDLDLSYSPDHIEKMLNKIRETKAKIVIASPYMKGGKISNVSKMRRILSLWANRFLSLCAKKNFSTITGMVRAYDRKFIKTLSLRAMDVDINYEIIYKAQLLGARIVEIPAHLNWSYRIKVGNKRKSSIRIFKTIISVLFGGFIFRPVMFFMLPGFTLMLISIYPLSWAFIHTITFYNNVPSPAVSFIDRLSIAVVDAFHLSPQSFIIGGITLILAIQLISLGILAFQSKRYFEDLFHFSTIIYRYNQENQK